MIRVRGVLCERPPRAYFRARSAERARIEIVVSTNRRNER
jgi:hypothetical protein